MRQQAEDIIKNKSDDQVSAHDVDVLTILHELDTYRVELEIQNQELTTAYAKLDDIHHRHYEIAPIGYMTLDHKSEIVEVNQTLVDLLGYDKNAMLRHHINEFVHPDDQDNIYFLQQSLAKIDRIHMCELRLKDSSGDFIWMKLDGASEKEQAEKKMLYLAVNDISVLKIQEDDLRLAASVFDECSDAITVTDAHQSIIKVNKAFTQITGYFDHEVLGKTPKLFRSEWQNPEFYRKMWQTINEEQHWQGELWNRRKNGELYPQWMTITELQDSELQTTNYIGVFNDMTQRKEEEAYIHSLAYRDHLTNLPNRLLLNDRYEMALALSERNQSHGAVFMLDLDHFKVINDSLGHEMGDKVLQETAERLNACVRKEDTVSRLGGDEFAVLLHDLSRDRDKSLAQASNVAKKIIEQLSRDMIIDNHKLQVSASIGIVMYPSDNDDIKQLITLADNAMYKAKMSGRNNFQFYTPELQIMADQRLTIQNDLREGLELQQFELYYQPQVDIATNVIDGAEALIRWHHPVQGFISPANFIPIAEETGIIIPIGRWIIEQVCRQISEWSLADVLSIQKVSVNISSLQFEQKDFVKELRCIIDQYGVKPEQLELELTESILVIDIVAAQEKLTSLSEMGFSLAIDDFGTGYSSMQYLKQFPINTLKIDRSFVRDIGKNHKDEAIVQTVIALAKNFDMLVLAEGVETQAQYDFLKQNGCDSYQGNYCGKPVSSAEFIQLLK